MKVDAGADVVIVGSGIAGTTIAFFLTRWGHRVSMFEAGPRYDYPHEKQYEDEILHLYRDPRYLIASDLRHLEVIGNYGSQPPTVDLTNEQIMVVGGMATRWSAWTPRFPPSAFRTKSLFGYGTDWPITYDELEPYYCKAEALLGISGTDDDNPYAPPRSKRYPLPAFPHSHADRKIIERLKARGIVVHTSPQARTSAAYDGRPGCANFGVCGVCPIGARYSPNHHLQQALKTGRLSLHADAAVRRVLAEREGRASGVLFYEMNRRPTEENGKIVVVAAGAIESARLLLLSARGGGQAARMNQSGQVGKNLMFNHIWGTSCIYPEPIHNGRIGASTAQSHHFIDPPGRPKHGGVKVDFTSQMFGGFGRDIAGRGGSDWVEGPSPVEQRWYSAGHLLGDLAYAAVGRNIAIHTETVPSAEKYVDLSSRSDRFGDPFAKVHHESSAFDHEAEIFAHKVAEEIAIKSGASEHYHTREFASGHHHIGTCRMGTDPDLSVVDSYGKLHGFSNLYVAGASVFPGSSAMNPTLTLVAQAIRTAEQLHAKLV